MMKKMDKRTDGLFINSSVKFVSIATFKAETIEKVFEFAYGMSFGKEGEHRAHRSGGTHQRRMGEIFANVFQGKLAEFAFYNAAHGKLEIDLPDLAKWDLGKWDDTDFIVMNKKINIKSTKSFGNLLLLETKDWNKDGLYIPNMEKKSSTYDYFILVRMKPFCEDIMKKNKIFYSDFTDKEDLKTKILFEKWEYDIPGWISHEDLKTIINDGHIIKRGELLNGRTKMDAENYYVQSGDMKEINKLVELLK